VDLLQTLTGLKPILKITTSICITSTYSLPVSHRNCLSGLAGPIRRLDVLAPIACYFGDSYNSPTLMTVMYNSLPGSAC